MDTFPIFGLIPFLFVMDILPIYHTQLLKVEFRHCQFQSKSCYILSWILIFSEQGIWSWGLKKLVFIFRFKGVMEKHKVKSLKKMEGGLLCIRVSFFISKIFYVSRGKLFVLLEFARICIWGQLFFLLEFSKVFRTGGLGV